MYRQENNQPNSESKIHHASAASRMTGQRRALSRHSGRLMLAGILISSFLLSVFVPASDILAQQSIRRQPGQEKNRIRIAQDYERRGNYQLALKIYRNLFEQVPRNQLYYEGVKRNMIRLKQFDELVDIIQAQMTLANSARFHADLGNVYYKQGRPELAMQTWEQALAQFADQKPTYTFVANAMISNRLYDEAIEVYERGRREFNQQSLFVFELANIYALRLKYKEATLEYLKHLENNPNQFAYIESRIVNYTKDDDNARVVADILQSQLPNHKQKYLVRKLLADLYLRIEAFDLAIEQFQMLENMDPPEIQQGRDTGRELYFFAEKALRAGKYAYAESAFDLILTKYPDSQFKPRALHGIAIAKREQGQLQEALTKLQELLQRTQKSPWTEEALYLMGEIYFEDVFDIDKALETYHAVIQRYPTGRKAQETHFRIGDCYAATGDFDKAQTWYKRATNLTQPDSPMRDQANYKVAYLHFLSGDYEAAMESLNKITGKIGADNTDQQYVNDALELTFLIEENRGKSEAALKAYAEAQKHKLQNDNGAAIRKLKEIVSDFPTAGVIDKALLELGELETRRENFNAAIDYYNLLLEEHGDSVYNTLAQKRIAEVYETGLGDLQKAYEAYEKVLVDYPNSLYLEEVRVKLRGLHERRLNN